MHKTPSAVLPQLIMDMVFLCLYICSFINVIIAWVPICVERIVIIALISSNHTQRSSSFTYLLYSSTYHTSSSADSRGVLKMWPCDNLFSLNSFTSWSQFNSLSKSNPLSTLLSLIISTNWVNSSSHLTGREEESTDVSDWLELLELTSSSHF